MQVQTNDREISCLFKEVVKQIKSDPETWFFLFSFNEDIIVQLATKHQFLFAQNQNITKMKIGWENLNVVISAKRST